MPIFYLSLYLHLFTHGALVTYFPLYISSVFAVTMRLMHVYQGGNFWTGSRNVISGWSSKAARMRVVSQVNTVYSIPMALLTRPEGENRHPRRSVSETRLGCDPPPPAFEPRARHRILHYPVQFYCIVYISNKVLIHFVLIQSLIYLWCSIV